MSISLTPEQERFVQSKLQAGKYDSVEEVLEIALRLLERQIRNAKIDDFSRRFCSSRLHIVGAKMHQSEYHHLYRFRTSFFEPSSKSYR